MNDLEMLEANRRAFDIVFKSVVELACLKGAMELDLFNMLAKEPRSLDALAESCAAVPVRLERFLISLERIGLLQKQGEQWQLTPLARQYFVSPPENPNLTMVHFADFVINEMESFYLHLADAVRGTMDFVSRVPHPPRTVDDSRFYEQLHRGNTFFPVKLLLEHARLENVRHLVDIGGGIGDIASALCEKYPELQVTLINLPSALDLVRENVAARGFAERITPLVIDMYREPYPQGDAMLFSRILYPMNEQFCTALCQRAYDALNPGGRILICDMIIDDLEQPNYDYLSHYLCAVGMDFNVLDFKSHSAYNAILQSIGFQDVTCNQGYDYVLYQAVKPV
jgi:bacteriochlorophyll C20 methyltransferase